MSIYKKFSTHGLVFQYYKLRVLLETKVSDTFSLLTNLFRSLVNSLPSQTLSNIPWYS